MNTYRVYALNTTVALVPETHVLYVRGEKYADAWKAARAALNGKPGSTLFTDPEASKKASYSGDAFTVAKIDDIKPRNVKLDKTALQAVLNDPKSTDSEKLKAMTALIG